MKILIGSNTYGRYHRQGIAVDSWKYLAEQYDFVDVVNVQFNDNTTILEQAHKVRVHDLNTIYALNRSSLDVTGCTKKLPYVNDILNCLSSLDYDYFIYVNSDIILNKNLIKHITKNKPEAFACSRMDIDNVDNFQDIIDRNIRPHRTEIAGFDVFVFKNDWFKQNMSLFRDYFMAQPLWDQVYATAMRVFGGDPYGNQNPPYCFHISHPISWGDKDAPERSFNQKSLDSSHLDSLLWRMFDKYLTGVLMKRQPPGVFIQPVKDENAIEREYFRKIAIK